MLKNKKGFLTVFFTFFYILIFALLLRNSFAYLDPDFGWHLEVGREIIRSHEVPSDNIYNFSFEGKWVDHEWLSDAGLAFLYDNFSYIFLSILFSFLLLVVLIILNRKIRHSFPKASPYLIVVLELVGIFAALPHFGVRIQEFGLLFLVLELIVFDLYRKKRNFKYLLALIPLLYLWSLIHGSFLLGFFLFGTFIFYIFFEKTIFYFFETRKINFRINIKEFFYLSSVFVLSFLSSLISPYGTKLYSFLGGYKDKFYLYHIQEWLPQHFFPFRYWQLLYLAIVVLVLVFYLYKLKKDKKMVDLWQVFIVVLFVILSFKSRRHFPLMFVATLPFIISNWPIKIENKYKQDNKFISFTFITASFLLSLFLIIDTKFTNNPFISYCNNFPCGAVNFLKQSNLDGKIFNQYNWGGFLIHEYPSKKIFIDGRLPQVQYKGHSFLAEYFEFFKEDEDEVNTISNKLKEHDISLILIPAFDKKIQATRLERFLLDLSEEDLIIKNNLRSFLLASDNWHLLYQDNISMIFIEKNKAP